MYTIRRGMPADIPHIAAIYERIHDREEAGLVTIGWVRGVYPTRATARECLDAGELFVLEEDGRVSAAARINRVQVPEYADAPWQRTDAPEEAIMVLHTLVVDPLRAGYGLGTAFVRFYEEYARAHAAPFLRMDTNARNTGARALYARLGYREVGTVPCCFNGIPGVSLVCLEKTLDDGFFIRTGRREDLDAVAAVEEACFPAAEAASRQELARRLEHYGGHFWLLFRGRQLVSFVDGMVTDLPDLTDELYERADLHRAEGAWQMIFGVNTLPPFRRRGCAAALLRRAIDDARQRGRRGLVLTCKDALVSYYAKFGFADEGLSSSVHGGAVWHQMRLTF